MEGKMGVEVRFSWPVKLPTDVNSVTLGGFHFIPRIGEMVDLSTVVEGEKISVCGRVYDVVWRSAREVSVLLL